MTLSDFKNRLKVFSLILFFILYGAGSFGLGRYFKLQDLGKIKKLVAQKEEKKDQLDKPLPYTDVQSGEVIGSYIKLCSNTVYDFEVAYPKDWFTTYNTENQRCTFFAPFSFVVPDTARVDFVPVRIEVVKPDEWAGTVKFYENPNEFQNVSATKNIQINDRSIEKIEASSTDQGKIPKGFAKISFLISDSKTPLIISYQQLDAKDDVAQMEKALEDMVGSLKYF